MSQVIKNPTPKQRFADSPLRVTKHRAMIESEAFEAAVDFAMLEYERQLSMIPFDNFNACAAAHLRKVGAHEFLQLLRNLCETAVAPTIKLNDNLDHRI
jgi:hypothetical protein